MKDFTIEEIKAICGAAKLPLGVPFIDGRLDVYKEHYSGAYPYYAALRDITRELKPDTVLEIGTWQGTSAACLAAGHPGATVMTVDHHSDPGDADNQDLTLDACERYPNIVYLQGCSTEMVLKEKVGSRCVFEDVKRVLAGRPLDILFVDGWHHELMARADYDTYFPLMANGGLIICDDIYGASGETLTNMMDFWNALPGEKYLDPVIHSVYSMGFIKVAK